MFHKLHRAILVYRRKNYPYSWAAYYFFLKIKDRTTFTWSDPASILN